jgi:hypothetical protein
VRMITPRVPWRLGPLPRGVVASLAGLGAAAALVGAVGPGATAAGFNHCGEERWAVKTLSDRRARRVDFDPQTTSVRALRRKPKPTIGTDTPRQPGVEMTTYRVRASLVEFKEEDDHDIHLVIAQRHHPAKTMIVEFPEPRCNGARDSIKKRAMARARDRLTSACGDPPSPSSDFAELGGTATIKGVGFFDIYHGQRGVAPNEIELHPVLGFGHARCRR